MALKEEIKVECYRLLYYLGSLDSDIYRIYEVGSQHQHRKDPSMVRDGRIQNGCLLAGGLEEPAMVKGKGLEAPEEALNTAVLEALGVHAGKLTSLCLKPKEIREQRARPSSPEEGEDFLLPYFESMIDPVHIPSVCGPLVTHRHPGFTSLPAVPSQVKLTYHNVWL